MKRATFLKRATALAAFLCVCVTAYALIEPKNVDRAQDWAFSGALSSSSASGMDISGGDITLENDEAIINSTDAQVEIQFNDDAVELSNFQLYSSNTATSDADNHKVTFAAEDSNSVKVQIAALRAYFDDVTSTTKDSTLSWAVMTNTTETTPTEELKLDGAKLYPATDAGLDLGGSSNEFEDLYIDGTANLDTAAVGSLTVNANGTAVTGIWHGSVTISNGATSGTVSLTGVDATDTAIITQTETNGSAAEFWAVPEAGALDVVCDTDPGTDITLYYVVYGD